MSKVVTFEVTEAEAAELNTTLEAWVGEMKHANERMRQDQEEIDRLREEARALAAQTRATLAQLEAALP